MTDTAKPQMYGRTARAYTMHRLDQDGRPVCGNKRIVNQVMVNRMTLESVGKHSFLSLCVKCQASA